MWRRDVGDIGRGMLRMELQGNREMPKGKFTDIVREDMPVLGVQEENAELMDHGVHSFSKSVLKQ